MPDHSGPVSPDSAGGQGRECHAAGPKAARYEAVGAVGGLGADRLGARGARANAPPARPLTVCRLLYTMRK